MALSDAMARSTIWRELEQLVRAFDSSSHTHPPVPQRWRRWAEPSWRRCARQPHAAARYAAPERAAAPSRTGTSSTRAPLLSASWDRPRFVWSRSNAGRARTAFAMREATRDLVWCRRRPRGTPLGNGTDCDSIFHRTDSCSILQPQRSICFKSRNVLPSFSSLSAAGIVHCLRAPLPSAHSSPSVLSRPGPR